MVFYPKVTYRNTVPERKPMEKQSAFFALIAATVALGGCASYPPVAPADSTKSRFEGATFSGETVVLGRPVPNEETYRVFRQAATGYISVATVRDNVEETATKQCERLGKAVHPVRETASKPPHILGNFPRVEWTFQCVDKPSGPGSQSERLDQIERLKKLLDSGAITRVEYDREKARILGMQ